MDRNDEIPDRTPAYARGDATERITKACSVCNKPFLVAPQCAPHDSTCSQTCAHARRKGYGTLRLRNKG